MENVSANADINRTAAYQINHDQPPLSTVTCLGALQLSRIHLRASCSLENAYKVYTLTLRCEGCELTDVSKSWSPTTSCVGTFGSPGRLRVAANAAFATASYIVSRSNNSITCSLCCVAAGVDIPELWPRRRLVSPVESTKSVDRRNRRLT